MQWSLWCHEYNYMYWPIKKLKQKLTTFISSRLIIYHIFCKRKIISPDHPHHFMKCKIYVDWRILGTRLYVRNLQNSAQLIKKRLIKYTVLLLKLSLEDKYWQFFSATTYFRLYNNHPLGKLIHQNMEINSKIFN